ncbi:MULTISPECIES: TRAP transporter substrate-binding protein [Halocynthiibacter]|uniref:TRAP transporter substrate-binding protein n=1 Tax=Halocynthiibacter halioticoli TaxID=2986804 RepID=A0AAE3IWD4_9RHOB|nr:MULTISPECIES: TRAP transporter substrate-binding protein [Halocynthiibacter]MCV6823360.1 TRAP transporter substrate-binding protein [Halocynthiibacter halioticoli]MCW4056361.1 TRAP transporter substrate-binding protein [Halocynthiibacter sp. SDUM655004]MDE0590673.1 TRAP transporter substrate-binding protein [Halocynthiibacter sp. C4]
MKTIVTAATAALMLGSAASADGVKLNMPSTFPGSLIQLGQAGVRFQDTVNLISGGEVEVEFFEPNALVPPLEIFDAVSSGAVDAGWSVSGYWGSKNSALNLFAAVPFGPAAGEYLAWMWYGGGEDLMNEVYHANGIHGQVCGIIAPEASGWFRKEINSVEDLQGLKMRFFGLGAKVMQKLGVDTQLLAGGDIYPALERGTIDATEFSMPAIDLNLGFYNIAKHYYFPGWHQQSTNQELLISLAKWEGMTDQQRGIIQTACRANVATQLAEGEAIQGKALAEIEGHGVTIHQWDPAILETLQATWDEVVAEEAAANPDFQKAWDSLQAFRAEYAAWNDLGYLD